MHRGTKMHVVVTVFSVFFFFLSRSFSNAQLEEVYKIPIFEGGGWWVGGNTFRVYQIGRGEDWLCHNKQTAASNGIIREFSDVNKHNMYCNNIK